MDEETRKAFVDEFGRFIISGYAAKFRRYHNEYFEPVEEKTHRRGQHIIRTKLILNNGESIDFNYILSNKNDAWRIINVAVKGISDLALKRAEFTRIIEKNGFEALIKAVSDKVAEIRERQEREEAS
jgi:phospholipid transport system substrate-binding protein